MSSRDMELLERRAFGWGLAAPRLAPGDPTRRDVAWRTRNGRRDLATVEGAEALAQDLEAAIATGLGTDPLNLDFGFDGARIIAETEGIGLQRERLRAAVAQVLAREPRVRRVLDVQVESRAAEPGGPVRDAVVTAIFETILGNRATIELEGADRE
jgi:hypothetical protein